MGDAARLAVDVARLFAAVSRAPEGACPLKRLALARCARSKISDFERCLQAAPPPEQLAGLAHLVAYDAQLLSLLQSLEPDDDDAADADADAVDAAEQPTASGAADDDDVLDDDSRARRRPGDAPDDSAALHDELSIMASQMKSSSLAINAKLRAEATVFDDLDDKTASNEAAVSAERDALRTHANSTTRRLFHSFGVLGIVAIVFCLTYLFIAAFPK